MEVQQPILEQVHAVIPLIAATKDVHTAKFAVVLVSMLALIVVLSTALLFLSIKVKYFGRRLSDLEKKEATVADASVNEDQDQSMSINDLGVAGAVHQAVNALYYQKLICALHNALLLKGYRLTRRNIDVSEAIRYEMLPYGVRHFIAEQVETERYASLYPHRIAKEIQQRVEDSMSDGYAFHFIDEIFAALIDQGFKLERGWTSTDSDSMDNLLTPQFNIEHVDLPRETESGLGSITH